MRGRTRCPPSGGLGGAPARHCRRFGDGWLPGGPASYVGPSPGQRLYRYSIGAEIFVELDRRNRDTVADLEVFPIVVSPGVSVPLGSIATSIVFGIIASTFLILLVLPAIYAILADLGLVGRASPDAPAG